MVQFGPRPFCSNRSAPTLRSALHPAFCASTFLRLRTARHCVGSRTRYRLPVARPAIPPGSRLRQEHRDQELVPLCKVIRTLECANKGAIKLLHSVTAASLYFLSVEYRAKLKINCVYVCVGVFFSHFFLSTIDRECLTHSLVKSVCLCAPRAVCLTDLSSQRDDRPQTELEKKQSTHASLCVCHTSDRIILCAHFV